MRLVVLILPLLAAGARAQAPAAPQTDDQKTFYTLGALLGKKVGENLSNFDLKAEELKFVMMGLQDTVDGRKPQVDDLMAFIPKLQALEESRGKAKVDVEKKEAAAFLDKMAKEKGASKLKSGLIYFEVKKGAGVSPKASDKVKVHYHGTLRDGKVFDSSVQRGQPAEFPLDRVIPCWTDGVQKMKVGGKAKLVCPTDIAYGAHPPTPAIPPGATLVFEVELVGINK